MEVTFTKVSDQRHTVTVVRADRSVDHIELDSRSFLRHDFAHLVVEAELEIGNGFWGSVAQGAPLSGAGLAGDQVALAETLAGPMQTMMRSELDPHEIRRLLDRVTPGVDSGEIAVHIHERLRHLLGRWKATPYRGGMTITWPHGS